MKSTCLGLKLAGVLLAVLTLAGNALADPILPGFDLFVTKPNSFVNVPGIGPIFLRGVPIDPIGLSNTDTIVERLGGLPSGGTGPIPIELVALHLTSIAPVTIGGFLYDVDILSGAMVGGPPSPPGTLTVLSHSDPSGGTFTSVLPVTALISLTPISGGPPLGPFIVSDTLIQSVPTTWSHTPPPNYPTNPAFPSGGFYPGPVSEIGQFASHFANPANGNGNGGGGVPEPSSLVLLGTGLAGMIGLGLARRRWARKKQ